MKEQFEIGQKLWRIRWLKDGQLSILETESEVYYNNVYSRLLRLSGVVIHFHGYITHG